MDEISSAEFRKRYASLKAPTTVTANGRTIGHWLPAGDWQLKAGRYSIKHVAEQDERRIPPNTFKVVGEALADDNFNTRPFTPVPKVRSR